MHATNCPNCGAPITKPVCKYCGTVFGGIDDALNLAVGKPVTLKFEHDGFEYEFRFKLGQMSMSADAGVSHFTDFGGAIIHTSVNPRYAASFSGDIEAQDGTFFTVRKVG